jgi:hypothetical protein
LGAKTFSSWLSTRHSPSPGDERTVQPSRASVGGARPHAPHLQKHKNGKHLFLFSFVRSIGVLCVVMNPSSPLSVLSSSETDATAWLRAPEKDAIDGLVLMNSAIPWHHKTVELFCDPSSVAVPVALGQRRRPYPVRVRLLVTDPPVVAPQPLHSESAVFQAIANNNPLLHERPVRVRRQSTRLRP